MIIINGCSHHIVFTKPLKKEFHEANIYLAEIEYTGYSQSIVVKFTQRYNSEAHNICAAEGYAPELIAVNDVGDWKMVAMEFIEGDILQELGGKPSNSVFHQIESAIQLLHNHNFVFADLRMNNVMVKKSNQKVMLIDFDWTGRETEDCYPPFMNHIQVDWPEGVEDDKPLKKEHDLIWLERIKIGDPGLRK